MKTQIGFFIAAGIVAVVASPAFAASNASQGLGVSATVSAVCTLSANDFLLDGNGRTTGAVTEMCNVSTGYRVSASYRPLANAERATLAYGTSATALDATGMSLVAFRSHEGIRSIPVAIDASRLDAPLAVAFSISPV